MDNINVTYFEFYFDIFFFHIIQINPSTGKIYKNYNNLFSLLGKDPYVVVDRPLIMAYISIFHCLSF